MKKTNLTDDTKKMLKKIAKDEQAHSLQSAVHLLSELEKAKDMNEKISIIQSGLMAFHAAIILKVDKKK